MQRALREKAHRYLIVKSNQKDMLQIRHIVKEMENGLVDWTSLKKDSELDDVTIENSRTEKAKRKAEKKKDQNIQELWGNYKRCNIHVIEGKEREKNRRNLRQYGLRVSVN